MIIDKAISQRMIGASFPVLKITKSALHAIKPSPLTLCVSNWSGTRSAHLLPHFPLCAPSVRETPRIQPKRPLFFFLSLFLVVFSHLTIFSNFAISSISVEYPYLLSGRDCTLPLSLSSADGVSVAVLLLLLPVESVSLVPVPSGFGKIDMTSVCKVW